MKNKIKQIEENIDFAEDALKVIFIIAAATAIYAITFSIL